MTTKPEGHFTLQYPGHASGGTCLFVVGSDRRGVAVKYIAWDPASKKPWGMSVFPRGRPSEVLSYEGRTFSIELARAIWLDMIEHGFVECEHERYTKTYNDFCGRNL